MRIKEKLSLGFLGVALLIGIVGYFSVTLSKQIFGLRTVELPMEQNLREVEVSIWEAIHAANSFRLTGHKFYEQLYHKQIGEVDEFYPKYQALTDSDEEKKYIAEFNTLWAEAKTAGDKMIVLTKKQKAAENEFFINVDEADDVLDFAIQAKWSADDPNLLAKEQTVREVEVSIWEAIHAAQQYTGLAGKIVRGGQQYVGDVRVAGKAAAKASLVKGDFKDLMEKQFEDVAEFWTRYKALPHEDFENAAIQEFDGFWEKAVVAGREVVSLHDQAEEQFNILFEKVDKTDNVLDFKMQEFIQKRIEKEDETAKRVRATTIAIVLFAFFSAISAGLFIARSIANPITKLRDTAVEIGKGDLSKRAEVKSRDEIGELAISFNQMTDEIQKRNEELQTMNEELRSTNEELETSNEELQCTTEELEASNEELRKTQEELIQKEKLAAVGQLASGVGHELRNPLGVIKNAVYYINSKLPEDPKLQKHIAIMEKEIANSNKIISDLLGFSRTRPPAISPQYINKVVEDTLEVVEIPKNVKLVKKLGADLPNAMADPDQIRQVFVNLSLNAIQAMSEGGQLKIATRRKDDFIEVEFTDTGCGILEENLKKLFDPFFTTRARGIGLGLAVTQGIIERHNGNIEVKSEVEKGTTFVVKLPVEKKEV